MIVCVDEGGRVKLRVQVYASRERVRGGEKMWFVMERACVVCQAGATEQVPVQTAAGDTKLQ